jgi:hypothetical protein
VKHSRTRAATFTAAITAIATAGITVGATTASAEQTDSQKIRREVSASKIFDHLDAFQRIADRNGGTRASGTAGYEASASYVERTLRDAMTCVLWNLALVCLEIVLVSMQDMGMVCT